MNGDVSRSVPNRQQLVGDDDGTRPSSSVGSLPQYLQTPEIRICEMGSLEDLEIDLDDLEGLEEVNVDSEPDDGDDASDVSSQYSDSFASISEILSRPPEKRSSDDVDVVLEFIQYLPGFANMTLPVRERLCSLMRLQTYPEQHSVLLNSGEEVDTWWVVFSGSVELIREAYEPIIYRLGEAFGVSRSLKRRTIQTGTLFTRTSDTSLLCVPGAEFHDVIAQSEQATVSITEDGKVVLVTEHRKVSKAEWAQVVVRGSESKLVSHMVTGEYDLKYVEDFLLTYRTFMSPVELAEHLEKLFEQTELRDHVARVVLLWAHSHISDFNGSPDMIAFLRTFRLHLEEANLRGEVRLLQMAVRPPNATFSLMEDGSEADAGSIGGRSNGFDSVYSSTTSLSQANENCSPKTTTISRRLQGLMSRRPASSSSSSVRSLNTRTSVGTQPRKGSVGSVSLMSTAGSTVSISPPPPSLEPSLPSALLPMSVIKLYRHDHQFRFIVVRPETTALDVVRHGIRQFEMNEVDESLYSLCHVSVVFGKDGHGARQKRLPCTANNLPTNLPASTRFYLKHNDFTANLVSDSQMSEMAQEGATDLLSLDPRDVARVVTLKGFLSFSRITGEEYIQGTWHPPEKGAKDDTELQRFSMTTNSEMFWVVTEIVTEPSLQLRARKIKFFLKVAKLCKRLNNFNTMFAITSGLSYGAVTRLRQTWEKMNNKEIKVGIL